MKTMAMIDLQEQVERLRSENELLRANGLSHDRRLNRLLQSVVEEVRLYAEEQLRLIKRLTQIGLALSVEKNLDRLLERIVDEARDFTRADAGTLYLVDEKKEYLNFVIVQNDTLQIRMGGTSDVPITLPPIPLRKDGEPNFDNVSSYAVLTGKVVNIEDVYETEIFDFTGPRRYDATTGYRSRSMLVIPMKNHQNDIIGVLQLLNAKGDETGRIIPFSEEYEDLVGCLASQAAVSLSNAGLLAELQSLFDAFLKSIATAVDQKSPYTGGHVRRVVDLATGIAYRINEVEEGPFKDVCFTKEEIEELRLAAWLHDVGKIVTPEHVINKRFKLETVFDRMELLDTRFDLIGLSLENECLRRKVELLQEGMGGGDEIRLLDKGLRTEWEALQEDRELLRACNTDMGFLSNENLRRIREVARKTFSVNGSRKPYLMEDELVNLSIRKGTLTAEERKTVEAHALMTREILKDVPLPRHLSRLLEFAVSHHEKLDGSGYPFGLSGDQISLQARVIALADIFESLTAKDRPYKRPMKLPEVVRVLHLMSRDGHIDEDLLSLFLGDELHLDYARRELCPGQVGEPLDPVLRERS